MAVKLSEIRVSVISRLQAVGIDDAAYEMSRLLALALGMSRADLISDRQLTDSEVQAIDAVVTRRCSREPLDRIEGQRGFYGMEFGLSAATLSPRADTETLVDVALECLRDHPAPRILDLGTGTGCVLLALLMNSPTARGVGVDIAPLAIEQAQDNAAQLGLLNRAAFIRSDWYTNVDGVFDIIVSNPPYIPSAVIPQLDAEVRDYDPLAALDGGADGLDMYRIIFAGAAAHLQTDGVVAVEIGQGQETDVQMIAAMHGFALRAQRADLAGIIRVLAFARARTEG